MLRHRSSTAIVLDHEPDPLILCEEHAATCEQMAIIDIPAALYLNFALVLSCSEIKFGY